MKFKGFVVHEDFGGLNKKDRRRITSAIDKQFISLDDLGTNAEQAFEREALMPELDLYPSFFGWPDGALTARKRAKKQNGRLLQGRTWDAVPVTATNTHKFKA